MASIGKYEILDKLGQGATSTVYKARDPFADRIVALKLIHPDALNDEAHGKAYRHLLVNEAALAGKLTHPHIVQIFDAVVAEDFSYIVMEYVAGTTLEASCKAGNLLPPERVVELIFKCTRALNYAFGQGVTHRDIKPANILIDENGDPKISDFGAAITAGADQTQVSGVGSPAWMSPQQVREMPLDQRTDIWSLGVVMYQMLTGRLPFDGKNNYDMIYQIIHANPSPPSSLRPELPPNLDAIVARAMHKSVEARYSQWEEFARDLTQAFRNQKIASQQQEIGDSEKFETLRSIPFFAEFTDAELWEVVRFSAWDNLAPGTVIMRDGEPGNHFCFVADGELKITKHSHLLNILSGGDCFGEMAVIGGGAHIRGADVTAATPARIVSIRGQALEQASETCRMHFYQGFLGVLAQRLAMANARLASI